ncbi:MAG: PAS domain-containing sensor histidine kinase [Anaerolineae bacterium]|nr:PAS domain-containing sensor histidine kinase [Anaerolineae bacterium]
MNITQINTAPKDVVRAAMRQTQTETQSIFEFQHQLASGDIRDVEVYSCSINIQGKSLLYGIIMDITERKRAEAGLKAREENYRQLVETMRGGLAVRDVDNRCTYVNDRFCELLGYSRDEVIGANLFDFLDEANTQVMESQFKRRQNLASASFESVFIRKDGRPVHMLISGSPLFDKNGEYNGSFAVMTDITTQKQAQETLRQALAKEKELGDLKTRFVSMASHEFRTPLATILALVETLSAYRHKLSEDQIDQRFDKIKVQVGHLKDIMEDVLLLARMQARRVDFDPARIDLDSLCRSVLDEFLNRADVRHPIHYSCDVMLQDVLLDKKLMRQMLSNLVSNAIKYSPPDKPIHVRLEYEESAVILEVRDFGMGIPEADLPHLFEPFHRAANVDTIPGTGLGLVIIKESVDLHGGTITVDSQLDMGTTFMINIPITTLGEMTDDENSDH